MKFLKTSFITAALVAAVMTFYPNFQDITESFQCLGRGRCISMPVNSEHSGEKIIFIYSTLEYHNKARIFYLTSENQPQNITTDSGLNLDGLSEIFVNKNAEKPLVLFDFSTDNQLPRLLSFSQDKFVTIPYQCTTPLQDIEICLFNCDSTIHVINLKCLQETTEKLLALNNEGIFVDISDSVDLNDVSDIAFSNNPNNPLALIIYSTPDKLPALFQFDSNNQLVDISNEFPTLQKISNLEFAQLIEIEDKLYVYGLTFNNRAQFFCLDRNGLTDITADCGLEVSELENIRDICFSNNLPDQLVCILYKNKQAKLFELCHGIFTDITANCGIDKNFFRSIDSVELIQDNCGITIIMNYNNETTFSIFHNAEIKGYTPQISSAATLSSKV